ncbi:MAG TPA: protein kinase [Gemmatimonadaceae bacterium]|nr:protein kinase [Gemmatimonadaceae bacterium]
MTANLREQLQETLSGSYTIDREIGGGGMSRVFAATDTSLDRPVVVKVLEPELAAGVNVERFRREIQVAAKLQHAYIVPLLSAGVTGELPFYTMPLVDGDTLRSVLQTRGALPIPEAVRIMRDIAEALTYAHEHGIAHRDIKPENILVTGYHALVTDFGVAKALSASTSPGGTLTSAGMALGTPAYMAPEQGTGDPATDHRADIYSFGAVSYEMLTGHRMFSERSAQATIAAHAIEKPEPLDRRRENTPASLVALVMQCVEKHPADRPQSAREILSALDGIVTTSGSSPSIDQARQSVSPTRASLGRRPVRAALIAGAAALIAAAGLGWWTLKAPDTASRQTKLVVLPFENLGEAADQYFADGVSEEVTNRLVKLSGLSVVARSSAAQYKKSGKTAQEIGRELGVDYVLDGTVRWARSTGGGNVVKVTPQLMRVSTGAQVWGEPYEAVLSEVFKLQTQIAENVAQALGTTLVASDRQALAKASTTNVEASDAYMLGRFHWKQRSPEGLERAARFFQQAIEKDPGFARAHSGLADSYSLYPYYDVTSIPPEEAYRRAKAAAARAIELDSTMAEGYASLGETVYYADWEWPRAYRLMEKATSLDPGYATAHQWFGELLFTIGHLKRSIAELRKASELEPLSAVIATSLGFALWANGDFVEAERELKRAVAIDPNLQIARFMAGTFYMHQGKPREAADHISSIGVPRAFVDTLTSGSKSEAARVTAVKALHGSRGRSPMLYSFLKEPDSAFAMIERELRDRNGFTVIGMKVDQMLRPLRSDPRWEAMLRLAGLTDSQLEAAGIPRPR